MSKVAPSARLREEIAAYMAAMEANGGSEALSRLARLGVARLVQEGLEQEQADFIGRERYERGERRGHRNGYVPGHLDIAEGRVSVEVPQVRNAEETCRSKLYDFLRGHSAVVERLAIEDRARLLGDVVAVTPLLDRLMHHGHLLKFEGRSWCLKEAAARAAKGGHTQ